MAGFDAGVTSDRPPTTSIGVWLELDLDAQPIEGTLSPPGDPPARFTGWLGLTAALEGLRGHEPSAGKKDQ